MLKKIIKKLFYRNKQNKVFVLGLVNEIIQLKNIAASDIYIVNAFAKDLTAGNISAQTRGKLNNLIASFQKAREQYPQSSVLNTLKTQPELCGVFLKKDNSVDYEELCKFYTLLNSNSLSIID